MQKCVFKILIPDTRRNVEITNDSIENDLFSLMAEIDFDRPVFVVLDSLRMNGDGSVEVSSRSEEKLSIDF
jgi:hypothetical protein